MKKRLISVILTIALLCAMLPQVAIFASATTVSGKALFDSLTMYYFTNDIQCRNYYRFYSDGTFEQYGYDYSDPSFDGRNTTWNHLILDTNGSRKYEIKGDALYLYTTLYGVKYTDIVKPVLKSSPIAWDSGMAWPSALGTDEYFFYETGYTNSASHEDNAMWLMRAMSIGEAQGGKLYGNVSWAFDALTGTLTISGSGGIYFHDPKQDGAYAPPWQPYEKQIKSIIIQEGITEIGGEAVFRQCVNVNRVSLPQSLTKIGWGAFLYCKSLESIVFPASLTEILGSSFSYCGKLEDIVIPKSVTHIGAASFDECNSLKKITIENKDCIIDSGVDTLGPPKTTTIYGYENSTAQIYAEKYGYSFQVISTSLPGEEYQLRAYSQSGGFSTYEGNGFSFNVGLYQNSNIVENWTSPALSVSNRDVAYASVGKKNGALYEINVKTNGVGTTNIVVSDSSSGASVTIPFTVYESYDGVNSFLIDNVPYFYPTPSYEAHVLTNFYNRNGIYINSLQYKEFDNKYYVTCTAYNQGYSHGAIDIYDADGNWKSSKRIDKFSDIQSLLDMGDYIIRMVTAKDGLIAYTSEAIGEKTNLSFEVPKGGYFTISNNCSTSIGAYIYNLSDFIVMGCSKALDLSSGQQKTISKSYSDSLLDTINKNEALIKAVMDEMASGVKRIGTETINTQFAADSVSDIALGFIDATAGMLEWDELLKTAAGVAEGYGLKLIGPAGWGIDLIFKTSKYMNYAIQTNELLQNSNAIPISVHTPHKTQNMTINGVSVNGNGSIPDDTILQVFRLNNTDKLTWFEENGVALSNCAYELYNICLVKDDKTISADGIITVKIKIPDDYLGDNLTLCRQEADGSWKALDYSFQGDFIIFYTDHFSNYVIFYSKAQDENPFDCGGDKSICPSAQFADVAGYGNWSHNGIDFCIDRGLFGGMSATRFEPDTAMNRAMLVTVLWRYEGSPKGYSNSFSDIKSGEWYTDAVSWASSNNIVNGVGGGKFNPEGIVTREQLATILYRYSEWKGFDVSGHADFSSFPDAGKVGSWAKAAMQWAVAENLIGGSNEGGKTYILPSNGATRAQVATILMRFIQNIAEEKPYDPKGHTYEYICGKRSWSEAQAIAKEKGGYLVHFDDMDEFNYVTRQLNRKGYRDIRFLIGGKRAEGSQDYYWVDTDDKPFGEKLNSPKAWCSPLWYSGEPTFEWQGVEECYLQLAFMTDVSQWVLNDIDDNQGYPKDPKCHGFIIEFE